MKSNTKLTISVAANVVLLLAVLATFLIGHFRLHFYREYSGMLMRRIVIAIENDRASDVVGELKGRPSRPSFEELVCVVENLVPGKDQR